MGTWSVCYGKRLFYSFDCGGYPFFVLDTRTQRVMDKVAALWTTTIFWDNRVSTVTSRANLTSCYAGCVSARKCMATHRSSL